MPKASGNKHKTTILLYAIQFLMDSRISSMLLMIARLTQWSLQIRKLGSYLLNLPRQHGFASVVSLSGFAGLPHPYLGLLRREHWSSK